MKPKIPQSLKTDHENLHSELAAVISSGGKVAQKAQVVADTLHPHFLKEEESVLPPLGILLSLAEGEWTVASDEILSMADKLEKEFSVMLYEHEQIVGALDDLDAAAKEEHNALAQKFVKDLKLHAQIEEQVLYPAVIVTGKYLRKLKAEH